MVEDNKNNKQKLSKRGKGRPPLEWYDEPWKLTEMMKTFCDGIIAGLSPAQVGANMGIGQKKIESWMENVAMKEYMKQQRYEKDRLNEMSFWDLVSKQNIEKLNALHIFFLSKVAKEEIPWQTAFEILKYLTLIEAGGHIIPTTETVETTETREVTTLDLLRGDKEEQEKLRLMSIDPKKLPVELGGQGQGGKRMKRTRSVKHTKKEGG